MNVKYRGGILFVCFLAVSVPGFAQQPSNPPLIPREPQSSNSRKAYLVMDVVVTNKSGKVTKGLEEKDFAVQDSGQPQKIVAFRAIAGEVVDAQPNDPPVKIIFMVDEINTTFSKVAYERNQITKFLQQNGGKTNHPVSLGFFSDKGIDVDETSTRDGNALLASFDQHVTALRSSKESGGFYGTVERFQRSVNALNSLAAKQSRVPGRKMIIWISPGWPLLSGPGVDLNPKQREGMFATIVSASTALRLARITLYSIDPVGVENADTAPDSVYEEFLKPVATAKKAQAGNLALQVLARQSGGLALRSSNDITDQLNRCLADADAYYTLAIDPAPSDHPDMYHPIEVKVAPGLFARTRDGYYVQP
ncbi:MAG TPA: VWA domain-containing protein [Edaphobacter sp.]|jgi:VWFA-related protein|nr:VWA domain-containing protein [Edaphobacter sp.]